MKCNECNGIGTARVKGVCLTCRGLDSEKFLRVEHGRLTYWEEMKMYIEARLDGGEIQLTAYPRTHAGKARSKCLTNRRKKD